MKKLIAIFLLLASSQIYAQPWKSIKGDGHIKKETRTVSDFVSISSHGSLDVKITNGHSNKIEVEADENLLPYIETTVENGKLIIRTKKNSSLKSASKMVVYVSMDKINSLQLSGSGNIEVEGNLTADENSKIMLSGSGNIHLNSGSFKSVDIAVSGSGNITVNGGSANTVSASVSGSGNVYISGLAAENVEVKISGSGNAKINANTSIDAKISGSGNVFYKGGAKNISSKVAGSGKLINRS
jgi:hypothetical protein